MPIVQVHILEGRTTEQKREMARRVTDAISETLGASPESIEIMITEMSRNHFAEAGVLRIDKT